MLDVVLCDHHDSPPCSQWRPSPRAWCRASLGYRWAPSVDPALTSPWNTHNINWRDVQRKYVVNKIDMSSLSTMTKWLVHKPTHRTTQKHVEHQDATDISKKKTLFFVFFGFLLLLFFFYNFLNNISKKCSVTALIWSMTFIGGLNQSW